MSFRPVTIGLIACVLVAVALSASTASAEAPFKREISYQGKQDLFYNYYEGPDPSGTAAGMYVSPRPVPAFVGHTYTTYQPLMPHEYLYAHKRSHYAYNPGAGWSRAKIRYGTSGLWLQHIGYKLSGPKY